MGTRSAGRSSEFARDLLKIFGVPLVILVLLGAWWVSRSLRTWKAASDDAVFDVAAGVWDWSAEVNACVENPHQIAFSPDRKVMTLTHRVPWKDSTGVEHRVTTYDIVAHDRSSIRGAIRDETRLTDDGKPVVWDLVLTSADSYAWHRTDWLEVNRTAEVRRCPADAPLIAPPD